LIHFIVSYYELLKVEPVSNVLHLYLQEKNYEELELFGKHLLSKGFLPEITIQDFPIEITGISSYTLRTQFRGGKKHRIFPVSANSVICLIQVALQILHLIQFLALIPQNYKTTIENIKIAAPKLLLRRLFLITGVL